MEVAEDELPWVTFLSQGRGGDCYAYNRREEKCQGYARLTCRRVHVCWHCLAPRPLWEFEKYKEWKVNNEQKKWWSGSSWSWEGAGSWEESSAGDAWEKVRSWVERNLADADLADQVMEWLRER